MEEERREEIEQFQPPYNLEAEKSLLGSALQSTKAAERATELLREQDFYAQQNRCVFAAMFALANSGVSIDLVTVADELDKRGLLEKAGGPGYLSELLRFVPSFTNYEQYIRIIEERSVQRQLMRAGSEISQDARKGEKPLNALLSESEKRIFDISMKNSADTLSPIQDTLGKSYIKIGELMKLKGQLTGVPTGFEDLDKLTTGLQPSDLIIVAGRPGMGKTSFALNIAQHAAAHEQRKVVVFSLEMSREQLVMRMLCSEAEVDMQRIKTGDPTEDDIARLGVAMETLMKAPLFIDDSAGITVPEMRSKCRRLKIEHHGLDLIVIDYLQLMQGVGRAESRQQEVSELTRSIKVLARELNVPIILLSQLSRAPEHRADKRPFMSDLRDSGSIEQDADIVTLLYREGYHDETADNVAQCIVAKHRNGPTETVELLWQGEYTRFKTLSGRSEY